MDTLISIIGVGIVLYLGYLVYKRYFEIKVAADHQVVADPAPYKVEEPAPVVAAPVVQPVVAEQPVVSEVAASKPDLKVVKGNVASKSKKPRAVAAKKVVAKPVAKPAAKPVAARKPRKPKTPPAA